jgi:uncharacterized membrane protein YfcA
MAQMPLMPSDWQFSTSLAIMAFTKLSFFLSYLKAGNVDLGRFKKLYLASPVLVHSLAP